MFSNKERINIITKKMNAVSFPLFEKQPEIPVALFSTFHSQYADSLFICLHQCSGGSRGRVQGVHTPPPRDDFLIQLVFCKIWR